MSQVCNGFGKMGLSHARCETGRHVALVRVSLFGIVLSASLPAAEPRAGRPARRSKKSRPTSRCGWPATAAAIIRRRDCSTTCGPRPWCSKTPHGTRVAIVTLDLVGIGRDLADPICARIADEVRPRPRRTSRSAARTRTADRWWATICARLHYDLVDDGQQQLIDRYADRIASERSSALVGRADRRARAQPDFVGPGHGRVRRQSPQQQGARRGPPAGRRQAGRAGGSRRAGARRSPMPPESSRPCCSATRAMPRCWTATNGRATIPASPRASWKRSHPGARPCSSPAAGPIKTRCRGARSSWPGNMATNWPTSVDAVLKQKLEPIAGNLAVGLDARFRWSWPTCRRRRRSNRTPRSTDRYVAARARLYLASCSRRRGRCPQPIPIRSRSGGSGEADLGRARAAKSWSTTPCDQAASWAASAPGWPATPTT